MSRSTRTLLLFVVLLLVAGFSVASGVRYYNDPVRTALRSLAQQGVSVDVASAVSAAETNSASLLQLLVTAGVDLGASTPSGETPLIAAVKRRSMRAVEALLDETTVLQTIDATDSEASWSALGHVLNDRNYELAGKLLAAGATPDLSLVSGTPLLLESLHMRDYKLFEFLLEAGADPNLASHDGQNCLAVALDLQSGELLAQLVDAGVDASAIGPGGEPLIVEQVRLGYHDQVAALLDAGANPDTATESGATSLMTAIQLGDVAMGDLLLDHGADASLGDSRGRVPLAMAISLGDRRFLEQLLRSGAAVEDPALVHLAYSSSDLKMLSALLKAGAPAEARNADGVRLLEVAVEAGDMEGADLILQQGASCKGLLWPSLRSGKDELLELVLKHGSNVREKSIEDIEPVSFALLNDRASAAAILLSHGADASANHPDGQSWLAHTIVTGKGEMALSLLKHGASAGDQATVDGIGLIAWAIAHGQSEVAERLVKLGGDVHATMPSPAAREFRDEFGSSTFRYYLEADRGVNLLMLAAAKKDHRAARALVQAGAKPSVYTKRKTLWPINVAAWFGDVEMMRIMLGKTQSDGRKIVVDLGLQQATLFEDGIAKFSTRVSTGKKGYRTPAGKYVVTNKHRHWNSTLYGSSMPYFLRLSCGSFGLHEGYVPSYPASHGCIRVPAGNAKSMYSLAQLGDEVEIRY